MPQALSTRWRLKNRSPHLRRSFAFTAHAIAFLLPDAQVARLSDPEEFWPVYQQHGKLVDSLPSSSGETVGLLVDYLASEARIQIPLGTSTDTGMRISPPEGVTVWMCLSRHDARVLLTRLSKRGLAEQDDAIRILTSYDPKFKRVPELCIATHSFFLHLSNRIADENDRLIVATIQSNEAMLIGEQGIAAEPPSADAVADDNQVE